MGPIVCLLNRNLSFTGYDCLDDLTKPGVALTVVKFTANVEAEVDAYRDTPLVLAPGSLKPGSRYKFSIKASYGCASQSTMAFSQIEITTNAPPILGKKDSFTCFV